MTLWDAYQQANKRRFAVSVTMAPGWEIRGQSELPIRVRPRRRRGQIEVEYPEHGTTFATTVSEPRARTLEVVRDA